MRVDYATKRYAISLTMRSLDGERSLRRVELREKIAEDLAAAIKEARKDDAEIDLALMAFQSALIALSVAEKYGLHTAANGTRRLLTELIEGLKGNRVKI